MTVHTLRPLRIPRSTLKCLDKLTQLARLQKLTGIAFVGYLQDGFIADACGEAHQNPDRTREMLGYLDERLRNRKGVGG